MTVSGEDVQDVGSDLRNLHPGKPPHQGLSIRTHQKLLEVPLDVVDVQGLPEESAGHGSKAVAHRWTRFLKR